MVRPDADFWHWIRLVLDPIQSIAEYYLLLFLNLKRINSQVGFALTELASPRPYLAEHSPVQVTQDGLVQNVFRGQTLFFKPQNGISNVENLGLVEFVEGFKICIFRGEKLRCVKVDWRLAELSVADVVS